MKICPGEMQCKRLRINQALNQLKTRPLLSLKNCAIIKTKRTCRRFVGAIVTSLLSIGGISLIRATAKTDYAVHDTISKTLYLCFGTGNDNILFSHYLAGPAGFIDSPTHFRLMPT